MRDLIIIGAGLAGSALATALARRGYRPLLIEQGHLPRQKVCGEFLSPDALHSLAGLGLVQAVARVSPWPVTSARLVGRTGREVRLSLPGLAWGVSRYALDRTLAESARRAGAEVRFGTPAGEVTPLPGGGFAVRVGGERVEARALVGAWGRQTVPALRAYPPPPRHQAWVGIKRHYTGVDPGSAVELYFVPGGYVGLVGVEEGRVNCSALVSLPAFRRAGGGVERFLQWAAGQNPALSRRLAAGTPVSGSEVTIAGVDTDRPPRPWTHLPPASGAAPVPLLGDAASLIPPLAGDGMAMALRSAELLLPLLEEHLEGRLTVYELAEAYGRLHSREFARRIRLARWLQAALVHPVAGEVLLGVGRWLPGLARRALLATRGPLPVRGGSPAWHRPEGMS